MRCVADVPTIRTRPTHPRIEPLHGLDPDRLTGVIRGARLDHCQLGRGELTGEVARIPLGEAHVDAAHYSLPLAVRGEFLDTTTVLVILDAPPGLSIDGARVRRGDLLLCPPGARIEAFLPGGTRWLSLQWRTGGESNERARGEVSCFRPRSEAGVDAVAFAGDLVEAARKDPTRLLSEDTRGRIASRLFSLLRKGLGAASCIGPAQTRAALRRRRAVRLAADCMRERLERLVSAPTLCEITDVSPRALAYYFRQTLGASPMAYYRALRFAEARRALLRPESRTTSVTGIATRFAFSHLGRFSVEYRVLFHESPSETLARSRRPAHRPPRPLPPAATVRPLRIHA